MWRGRSCHAESWRVPRDARNRRTIRRTFEYAAGPSGHCSTNARVRTRTSASGFPGLASPVRESWLSFPVRFPLSTLCSAPPARQYGCRCDPAEDPRNFAWTRNGTTANESRVGDGVVRRAERTDTHQSGSRIRYARHAVNLGGLKCLFETKRRQDGRNALRQHGLARAGRADHQDVMATGAGNFEGALGGVLSGERL